MKTKKELHDFIDGFVTRYKGRLSQGQNLKHIYDRELMRWMNGISWFCLDGTYIGSDGSRLTVRGQFEEYDLFVEDKDGDIEQVYIDHDDIGEIFFLKGIQYKSY